MKIAVIGDGRTGQEVVKLLNTTPEAEIGAIFNEHNPLTLAGLENIDLAIIFVPPTAMEQIVPILIASRVNVICGTTGYQWPTDLAQQVKQNEARWVLSHNFSLGMNLMRRCLEILGQSRFLYGQPQYHLREVHHVHKLDAPSGTAISWRDWLGVDCEIESVREGDVKGIHQLVVETEFEQISLSHEAKDRAVFAQGAVWAALNLGRNTLAIDPGVHPFSMLVDMHLSNQNLTAGA